uniref:BPL/LPL catalytic domain-containing protein n=1 Tax=Caenorhabditis tropicalis TaxID=1561998 RepID=A0A1I7UJ20_9PELO
MWSNTPTVVIGRHQNPWVEVNIPFCHDNDIQLARRHSGGGTVYHDEGNLNISLLTTHAQHCRPKNLRFISDALNEKFSVSIQPNKRDDMELQPGNRKCSGTAARIARGQAYHHLTLLVDADLETLSKSLRSPYRDQIETNATRSVRAPAVGFLRQDDEKCSVREAEQTIVKAYRKLFESCQIEEVDVHQKTQENDEIKKIIEELKSWKWIYGKSPKFTYHGENHSVVEVKDGLIDGNSDQLFSTDL